MPSDDRAEKLLALLLLQQLKAAPQREKALHLSLAGFTNTDCGPAPNDYGGCCSVPLRGAPQAKEEAEASGLAEVGPPERARCQPRTTSAAMCSIQSALTPQGRTSGRGCIGSCTRSRTSFASWRTRF